MGTERRERQKANRQLQQEEQAKQERKAERAEQGEDPDDGAVQVPEADQATVLAQLADLHAAFDDGKINFDDFEARRDGLTSTLRVD